MGKPRASLRTPPTTRVTITRAPSSFLVLARFDLTSSFCLFLVPSRGQDRGYAALVSLCSFRPLILLSLTDIKTAPGTDSQEEQDLRAFRDGILSGFAMVTGLFSAYVLLFPVRH